MDNVVLCSGLLKFLSKLWELSGRVLDSNPRGHGSSLTGVTTLCP